MRQKHAYCFILCALVFWMQAFGLLVEPSCAQTVVLFSSRIKNFQIKSEYGTLGFRGNVERTDLGDSYKYQVHMAVVFLPGETLNGYMMINRTKVADLKSCQLVATLVQGENRPYLLSPDMIRQLYREEHPIAIRLMEFGEIGLLDLEFHLSKSIANSATHIGLGVTDGRLLWPIMVELK